MMGWLVPVGTPGGICSGLQDVPDGSGIVRLGAQTLYLDPSLYRVWRAAAAAPQAEELIEWATTAGIIDAAGAVRELVDAGLLIGEREDAPRRIGRLALHLTGECLGNGNDRGVRFGVSGRQGTRLDVDAYAFELLLRTDGLSPVSVLCESLDRARPELGHRPCLETLSESLPLLVRTGVVRLDAAAAS